MRIGAFRVGSVVALTRSIRWGRDQVQVKYILSKLTTGA
jgi:hypothetical protein